MKILKATSLIGLYLSFGIIVTGLFDWGYEVSTGFLINNNISILVGLVSTLILVWSTISKFILEIDGNNVVMTIDLLFPSSDKNNNTIFNLYTSGISFLWPWEKVKEEVNLEVDIADEINKLKVSSKDDDIFVDIQYDIEPDPENLSLFVLNGENETERDKNLKIRISTLLKRQVEIFSSDKLSADLVIGSFSDLLQEKLEEALEQESTDLGIRVRKVRIGNIDFSEEVSKARNDRKTIQLRIEALKDLKDSGMSQEAAESFLLAQEGKSNRMDWNLNTTPGLQSVNIVGIPGMNDSKDKKKGKENK